MVSFTEMKRRYADYSYNGQIDFGLVTANKDSINAECETASTSPPSTNNNNNNKPATKCHNPNSLTIYIIDGMILCARTLANLSFVLCFFH